MSPDKQQSPLALAPTAPIPEAAIDAVYERLSPPPSSAERRAIIRRLRALRALWHSEAAKAKRTRRKKPEAGDGT